MDKFPKKHAPQASGRIRLSSARERGPAFSGTRGVPRGRAGASPCRPRSSPRPPSARPPRIGMRDVRPQMQVLRLAGLRRRACVGSGRGQLCCGWGNRLLQGADDHATEQLRHTCTTRSGPSGSYGKMSHRALSFITPLTLLAGPCWSALSHRQVQVQ